tara:strand:+ start:248 stop:694 length:447 start_codon:yes stop_codon:yes gene_type:complete
MSTIVGTNIEVTNIKYDSDTTSMIISDAGQVTIQGEGTATTNLQQGLAKAWLTMDGTGTIAIVDSFNIAGITDNNTGNHSYTYSNNIATTKHPVTGSVIGSTSTNYFSFAASNGTAQATTGSGVNTKHHSGATDDQNHVHILTHGDLS